MPREFRHMQEKEREIIEQYEKGLTQREIGENLVSHTSKCVNSRPAINNRKQKKLAAGIAIKHKSRPPKDYVIREQDKVAELKYILARKEAKVKTSEIV